jgi:NTE family protein
MTRSLRFAIVALSVGASLARAQECRPGPTALVLSGGGSKGLAHIGLLAVLDSLGVRPDLIVGTSIGAIVGALYASGYTAHQIDSLARGLPISELVRSFRVPAPHPWDHRVPMLFLVRWEKGFALETGVVDETAPNARLNAAMLRGNLLARGRFDRLPIPFRAVATDLRDRSTVVLSEGDLAQAVRASSAIPLVFPPVQRNGAVLIDGGISANIPIAEARAAGALRVIVSDVTAHAEDSLDVESPIALADQLVGFLFRQPGVPLGRDDILIRPAVQEFRGLDFSPETIREIVRRGRRAADTSVARARCLPIGPRQAPPRIPAGITGWRMAAGFGGDSLLIARMLELGAHGPLEVDRLRQRLVGLGSAEAFRGIWLHPSGTQDSVGFEIEPIRSPSAVGGLGVAYDNELGGRAWAGIFDRRVFGSTVEGSGLLSVGRFQREAYGAVLWHSDAGPRITPLATMRLRSEDIRQFDPNGTELGTINTLDGRVGGALELWFGEPWRVRIGGELIGFGGDGRRGVTKAGGSLRVDRDGRRGPEVIGEALVNGAFQSARIAATWPVIHRSWNVVSTLRAQWGHDLPLEWTTPLGGDQGFPGLHLGEVRGTNELSLSGRFGYSLKGPLQLRLLVATGRTWTPNVPSPDWKVGARLGLGADTPVGPMDVAYGVDFAGRGALYVRLGKWF